MSIMNNVNASIYSFASLYPTNRTTYCYEVGLLGQDMIAKVLEEIFPNSIIFSNDLNFNGADIKVHYNDIPIIAIERINEYQTSYIDERRARSIRDNLKGFKYKVLVSNFGNLTVEAKRILKNIPIIRIGFQLLPKYYHDFYSKLNLVHNRKIANSRSLKYIKNLLLSFFYRIGLLKLMYASNNIKNNSVKSSKTNKDMYVCLIDNNVSNVDVLVIDKTECLKFRQSVSGNSKEGYKDGTPTRDG